MFWCLNNGSFPFCRGDNYVYMLCTHNYLLHKEDHFYNPFSQTISLLMQKVLIVVIIVGLKWPLIGYIFEQTVDVSCRQHPDWLTVKRGPHYYVSDKKWNIAVVTRDNKAVILGNFLVFCFARLQLVLKKSWFDVVFCTH